ncbi:MAG TPA: excinuclease ABC subunit UvrC [bacterium]|nr:excinuclease ABC subunit UvrC [bacterium]
MPIDQPSFGPPDPPHIPPEPGVYLFLDETGAVLYVGKARNLKSRVRQYFAGHDERPLVPFLMRRVTDIRVIVVRDEREALVLERRLIKRHRPPYNIDLKDDKSYPYLAFTDEKFPFLVVTRKPHLRYRYLRGPFTDAALLRRFRRALLACHPLRRCIKMPAKACVYHQIGLCPAPCEGRIAADEYDQRVRRVIALIEGRDWREFGAAVTVEIERAAAALRFEKAAELRDILRLLPELGTRFGVESARRRAEDTFFFSNDGLTLFLTVGSYADGALGDIYHFHHPLTPGEPLFYPAIASFYAHRPPPAALSCHPPEAVEADALERLLDAKVDILPMRPEVRELLLRNHSHFKERLSRIGSAGPKARDALAAVVGAPVESILCLDISTLQGSHTVAGAVWWEGGRFVTKHYRRFTIRTIEGQNDPAAIAEAASRFRAHWENGDWPKPDLVLVDGGTTQVQAALREIGDGTALLGIVKDRRGDRGGEKLVAPTGEETLLDDGPFALLLKRIRDEAHRFAITANRTKRKEAVADLLGGIPGIGPAREKVLIGQFRTVERIRSATREELRAVPGLTQEAADAVWRRFHEG